MVGANPAGNGPAEDAAGIPPDVYGLSTDVYACTRHAQRLHVHRHGAGEVSIRACKQGDAILQACVWDAMHFQDQPRFVILTRHCRRYLVCRGPLSPRHLIRHPACGVPEAKALVHAGLRGDAALDRSGIVLPETENRNPCHAQRMASCNSHYDHALSG